MLQRFVVATKVVAAGGMPPIAPERGVTPRELNSEYPRLNGPGLPVDGKRLPSTLDIRPECGGAVTPLPRTEGCYAHRPV